MKLERISLEETECFSPLFNTYIGQDPSLSSFYSTFPSIENFGQLIKNRRFPEEKRFVLSKVLHNQYGGLENEEAVNFNIHSLAHEKTFTVTTGHQLNIFTGPLYFIYKIVTVINACQDLKDKYPDYHFVPIYWMASEDHDFEEINHFNLFGKTYRWETDQKGPVGRFKPHTINSILNQLPESVALFEKAYLDSSTLADATRFFVNELFGKYGLLVLDADNPELKALFQPVIEREILENKSNNLVVEASEKLVQQGYKSQAFSREINFFYIENEVRERFVIENDGYRVLNTDKYFSATELKEMIQNHPERFSPNVITRPLYQETILPNLAYCGGPAEICYWLQLKTTFEFYETPFPALLPRNFALVINKANAKKIHKLKLELKDIFKDTDSIKSRYLDKIGSNGYDLSGEKKELASVFEKIKVKALDVDQSLSGFIGAESTKSFKILEEISKKMKKAEENNNEIALSQIEGLKEKLFPNNSLQERHDNFLNFYLNNPEFIQTLLDKFDPFDFSFNILLDE